MNHNSHLAGGTAYDAVTGQTVRIVDGSTFEDGVRVDNGFGVATVRLGSLARITPPRPKRAANDRPYYVLTRYYKANGDCEKRTHTFATRAQQLAFIRRTKRAVTAYN